MQNNFNNNFSFNIYANHNDYSNNFCDLGYYFSFQDSSGLDKTISQNFNCVDLYDFYQNMDKISQDLNMLTGIGW